MILTEDFNINYMFDGNGELKSNFTLFQLKQIIKTAARVAKKTESLIDFFVQMSHLSSQWMTFMLSVLVTTT